MRAQLRHLAQAYFHQDYDLEFNNADEAVIAFAKGEGLGAASELAFEIDNLLVALADEEALADLWVLKLGAAYEPATHGQTYREWFVHMRELLSLSHEGEDSGRP